MAVSEQALNSGYFEQSNTQTTWLVPTKYKIHWLIEDANKFSEIKCPKISGPAETSYVIFVRIEDKTKCYVEMECFSAKAPIKIKGEILIDKTAFPSIKATIKKGSCRIKLHANPVEVSESNLKIDLEFISFPVQNQFLKMNKKAALLGETLKDFMTENNDGKAVTTLAPLTDCSLIGNQELLCHKAILSSRSPKLDFWLESSYPGQNSALSGCNKYVLQGLLDYLYAANPYELIKKYSLDELKKISDLGQKLGISEMDSLFEERDILVTSKVHRCCTVFESMMVNKDYFALEPETCYKFPHFSFCKSEWQMEFLKQEAERHMIVLNKLSRENVFNTKVNVSYMDFKNEWIELQEIKDFDETNDRKTDIKHKFKPRKRKGIISKEKKENKPVGTKTQFAFIIESEFLKSEIFKTPISSNAEKFEKLVLKCELRHHDLWNNINVRIKTFDAFRFLYDRLHFNSLFADLKKLHDSKKHTDLIITAISTSDTAHFRVHKIILAARSSIFRQKIHESNDSRIEVVVNKPLFEQFHQIIRFLYTNEIDFGVVEPVEAYGFAYENKVVDLIKSAREYLIHSYLSEYNANNIMQVAIRCEDELFKEDIKKYMSSHHERKWNPDTKEFILKPNLAMDTDELISSVSETDTEVTISDESQTMDTDEFTSDTGAISETNEQRVDTAESITEITRDTYAYQYECASTSSEIILHHQENSSDEENENV